MCASFSFSFLFVTKHVLPGCDLWQFQTTYTALRSQNANKVWSLVQHVSKYDQICLGTHPQRKQVSVCMSVIRNMDCLPSIVTFWGKCVCLHIRSPPHFLFSISMNWLFGFKQWIKLKHKYRIYQGTDNDAHHYYLYLFVIFFQKCMARLWDLLAFLIENMIIVTVAHNLFADNNIEHFISLLFQII